MDWRGVDERLIRCCELLLILDFLERYDLLVVIYLPMPNLPVRYSNT
jgi:hypothetical protein